MTEMPSKGEIDAARRAWDQKTKKTVGEMRRLAKYRANYDKKAFGDIRKSARETGRQGKNLTRLSGRARGLRLPLFRGLGAGLAGPAAFALFAAAVLKAYGDQQSRK